MKISAYHKKMGDNVNWVTVENYDRTYLSKVFTFSPDFIHGFGNYGEIIKGGTGFKMTNTLPSEIDKLCPDYSIYPKFKAAYGFLTRGCPNKCSWCVVPSKEGNIQPYADIEEFLQDRKEAVLMDNNVLAHEHGLNQIEKIIRLGIKVDFNQGLDARIIANDKSIAQLLSKVKWSRYLRLACDTKSQIPYIEKALLNLNEFGFKNYRVFVYVLVKDIQDSFERIEFLKKKGCSPFAQPFRDFKTNKEPNDEQKKFSRWVNHKAIFNSVEWSDYNTKNARKTFSQ
jgi:MoaA/NifB/PqqE/SkfB family radical SAM enzyme